MNKRDGVFPHPALVFYENCGSLERLQKASRFVELVDENVEILGLRVNSVPRALGVVPLGVEVFDVHALLLNPGVVLEVVDSLALGRRNGKESSCS